MDWHSYRKLPQDEKKAIWQELADTTGWQVIQDFYRNTRANKPDVKDENGREAFYFAAVKEAGAVDVLEFPHRQDR